MIFAWSALLAAGLVLVMAAATRSQYLVVLRSFRYGTLLLERRQGEQYQVFAPYLLPVVLLRYLAHSAVESWAVVQRRMIAWAHTHLHRTAGAKA